MVAYYLQMQPHLFRSAVETEFHKLKEQRDAEAEQEGNEEKEKAAAEATGSDLVLYRWAGGRSCHAGCNFSFSALLILNVDVDGARSKRDAL